MQKILETFNIQSGDALSRILEALLAIAALIVLVVIIRKTFSKLEKRASDRGDPVIYLHVAGKVLVVIVLVIGCTAVFSSIPAVKNIFSSLLASSGVAALVLSLAAQDAIGNVIGGFMINVSKPFKVGDTIRFIDKNTTGVVEKITLRHTVIRTVENKYVIVPNGTINSSVVENISYGGDICIFIEISVTYESDVKRAMELLSDAIAKQPDFKDMRSAKEKAAGAPAVSAFVSSLSSSEIILKAPAWVPDMASGAAMKSNVYLTMLEKIKGENVDFAYPHVVVVGK